MFSCQNGIAFRLRKVFAASIKSDYRFEALGFILFVTYWSGVKKYISQGFNRAY
jgi:hypothetical protein